jgi:hypothetical protein
VLCRRKSAASNALRSRRSVSILDVQFALTSQAQVRLIDQRGSLQKVSCPLPAHVLVSEPVQFVKDQWNISLSRAVESPPDQSLSSLVISCGAGPFRGFASGLRISK